MQIGRWRRCFLGPTTITSSSSNSIQWGWFSGKGSEGRIGDVNPDFLQYSWQGKNKFVSLVSLLPMYQSILDKHTSLPPTRISAAFWRFPPEVVVIIISYQSPTLQGTNISYLGKRKIIDPQVPAGDGMHQMPIAPGDLPCEAWPTLGRHQWAAFHSRGNGCRLNGLMAW